MIFEITVGIDQLSTHPSESFFESDVVESWEYR